MRPISIAFSVAVITCAVHAQAQAPADPPHLCARAKSAAPVPPGAAGVPAPCRERAGDTDVLHYSLDIDLNPATTYITGSNTMTVRSQADNLTTFVFRLDDAFTLSDVRVNGTSVTWTHLDEANVQVTLDQPYNVNQEFALYVAYDGYPVEGQGMGAIDFRYRNGAPEVYTLSEPWFAFTWWPAKDDLTDKTTADLWFTVPNTMVVGSNGTLQGVDTVSPGKLRYRWQSTYPAADYLYSIAATNFNQFTDTWTYGSYSMPLQFFIYPEDDSPGNRNSWLIVSPALTVYSDLFGLYPFVNEKYGMAEFGWGGGMEHQTLTSIGPYFGWESGYVHEASHQWWGDNVTCATWHDIWLNEGFATYSEALWYENKPGSSGEPALHSAMNSRRPSNVNDTVYCYDISNVNRIFSYNFTYLKAGWVLHMLRHVLGDATFYQVLAAYRAAYQDGAATTEDFRAVCEAVSGRDLYWFFWQWVYDMGAPAYQYGWRQVVLDNQRYLELYLLQVQYSGPPVFTMPIDVKVTQQSGATTYVVWNDASTEHLLIPVTGGSVSSIQLDPKPWILWTNRTTTSFVEGPPKIVTMTPAPDAVLPASNVTSFEAVFHKAVTVDGAYLSLIGQRGGPIPFTYVYNATRKAVTITPGAPLATDTYTLTLTDGIVETIYNIPLDGELVKPDGPNLLPTGDGLPGGNTEARFLLTSPGDLDCDGDVDFDDIEPFVLALSDAAAYEAAYPGCPLPNADADGDGDVDFDDINPFVALLGR